MLGQIYKALKLVDLFANWIEFTHVDGAFNVRRRCFRKSIVFIEFLKTETFCQLHNVINVNINCKLVIR